MEAKTENAEKSGTTYHQTAGCFLLRWILKEGMPIPQVLLIYKKWTEENQGWVVPKGHMEPGENAEQAVLREMREETGYQHFKILKKLPEETFEYIQDGQTQNKTVHWFLAELLDESRKDLIFVGTEVQSFVKSQWFNLDAAKESLKFANDKKIMDFIIKNISKLNPRGGWALAGKEMHRMGDDKLLIPDFFEDENLDFWEWESESKSETESQLDK